MNYYQMKQEGTTWEPYRAEANGAGGGHAEEAVGEAAVQ